MPLSQYHQSTTKDKPEAAQSRGNNCSADLFSMPDHEFAELLWENGQIVMQGHSSKPKKSSFSTTFSSHAAGIHEKDGRDAGNPKASRFDAMEPMVNDFSPSGPSADIVIDAQDDDMVPWISYPIEEPLPKDAPQNNYCSEFFNEFPGANLNSPSAYNKRIATDGSSGMGLDIRNPRSVEHEHSLKAFAESSEPSRVRSSQLFQFPQHCRSSAPSSKSRATDTGISDSTKTHLQNQDPPSPEPPHLNGSMPIFPHFSRPAMLSKANLDCVHGKRTDEKAPAPLNGNTVESTLMESSSVFESAIGVQGQSASVPPEMELWSSIKPPQEVIPVEHSGAICQQDASRKNNSNILPNNCSKPADQLASSSVMASVALRRHKTEKAPEAVAASSSVCSANGAGAASNGPKQGEKRKSHEREESGYQSEDFEDVSVGLRKPATGRGTGAKRSRAAEVHNLSERRRRDRINEKMRALQELIPNCNKVDKASMLEEAIEYLKTLQMQVQIMSMTSGICMPPMLLPPGMQHMHAPAMVRYSPMGVGMGMGIGFGYGMGMYDINGSPSCPMIPVPPMHGPQFPCSPIPASLGLHGMPGSVNHQMFGVPVQGGPLSIPRPSPLGSLSGLPFAANSVPEITAPTTRPILASDTAPTSISEDQQQQNVEALHGSSIDDSQIQTPNQAVKKPF